MPVTRASTGLVFSENFDALALGAQPTGWTKDLASCSFTVENAPAGLSGRALFADPAVDGGARLVSDMAARQDGVVQVLAKAISTEASDNVRPGVAIRYDSSTGRWMYAILSHYTAEEGLKLVSAVSGSTLVAYNFVKDTPYILRVAVSGDQLVARVYNTSGTLLVSGSITVGHVGSGRWGVYAISHHPNSSWWDDYRVFESTVVTATGLPAGWKIRLGTETATADAAGAASLDYTGVFPVATLEVLDDTDTLQDSITPADGVWGGDAYTYAAPQPPTAAFTSSLSGKTLSVDASSSTDPDGSISSYSWDWGDGSPAGSGVTAEHTYEEGGDYTITLTITDDQGETDTATEAITVGGWAACAAAGATPWVDCGDVAVGSIPGSGGVWYNDFSGYATGAAPSDWTRRFEHATAAWEVIDGTALGAIGDKVLRSTGGLMGSPELLSWDEADDVASPMTLWTRLRVTETDTYVFASIGIRGKAGPTALYGGLIDAHASGMNPLGYEREVDGTSVIVSSDGGAVRAAINTWYWLKLDIDELDANGHLPMTLTLYADVDGAPGDAIWTLARTETHTSITSTVGGWFGVGRNGQQGATIYFDVWKLGPLGTDHTKPPETGQWSPCDEPGASAWGSC